MNYPGKWLFSKGNYLLFVSLWRREKFCMGGWSKDGMLWLRAAVRSTKMKLSPFTSPKPGLPLTTYLPFLMHNFPFIIAATHFRSIHRALNRLTATEMITITMSAKPISSLKGLKSVSDISRYRYTDTITSLNTDIKCSKGFLRGLKAIERA